MGLQQFERRLERMVEGVFARAFRSGLQPVEVGRRLSREMDLRRTVAPRGTLTPNRFTVFLSPEDRERFEPIEDELVSELVAVAKDHARAERYVFIGPVSVSVETDEELAPGICEVVGEMARGAEGKASLVLPEGRRVPLGKKPLRIGRLPDSDVVLPDPGVSRRHAEIRPGPDGGFMIADLGSTNGTKVNGILIAGAHPLKDGDQIVLGATAIRFEQV